MTKQNQNQSRLSEWISATTVQTSAQSVSMSLPGRRWALSHTTGTWRQPEHGSHEDRWRTVWRKGELRLRPQEGEFSTRQVIFRGVKTLISTSALKEDCRSHSFPGKTPVVESRVVIHILRALPWGKPGERKAHKLKDEVKWIQISY